MVAELKFLWLSGIGLEMLRIELTRVTVKVGKSKAVDEWLGFLRDHLGEVLLTLDAEKMYVESIFRENIGGSEYMYWYSIQGENGRSVETSEDLVDRRHLEYWDECIEPGTEVDIPLAIAMIQAKVEGSFERV